jgi:hypothetical protein
MEEQRRYLDWACEVIKEMQRHPRLHDEPGPAPAPITDSAKRRSRAAFPPTCPKSRAVTSLLCAFLAGPLPVQKLAWPGIPGTRPAKLIWDPNCPAKTQRRSGFLSSCLACNIPAMELPVTCQVWARRRFNRISACERFARFYLTKCRGVAEGWLTIKPQALGYIWELQ